MDESIKSEILAQSRIAHGHTEAAYRDNPCKRGDAGWPEKQRILLADMALHLVQTSLREGELNLDDLKRNLYAILTISDQFLPEHDLQGVAEGFYTS